MAFGFHSFCWNVSSPSFCSFKGKMSFSSQCSENVIIITVFQQFDNNKAKYFICIYLVWSLLCYESMGWSLSYLEKFGPLSLQILFHSYSYSLLYLQDNYTNLDIWFSFTCPMFLFFPFFDFFFFLHDSFQVFCIDLSSSLLLYVVCCQII